MSRPIANVELQTDTFNTWILRTNEVINFVNTRVLADGSVGSTGSPVNVTLVGDFTANNINLSNNFVLGSSLSVNNSIVQLGTNVKLSANGTTGANGQILTTDGSRLYWSTAAGTGTVTQVANGSGIIFSDIPPGSNTQTITSFGKINIKAGDGIVVDTRGISVNTQFFTANFTNATSLLGSTWSSPPPIGNTTANSGTFTIITSNQYRITNDPVFLLSNTIFRTQGYIDATTPGTGTTGGVRVRGTDTGVAYIQITDRVGSTEWGNFKIHSNGMIMWTGSLQAQSFPNLIPSGTAMLFAQTTAPVGWTKSTTHNNKALRVVSGTAGSGGSRTFSSVFSNSLFMTGNTSLTLQQMPEHFHGAGVGQNGDDNTAIYGRYGSQQILASRSISADNNPTDFQYRTSSEGNGAPHNHTLNFDLAYVDVIIATKN